MNNPLIAKEVAQVIAGRESPNQALVTLITVAITDVLLTRGITMDLIYIPADYTFWTVLIVACVSILGPVLSALYLKTKSNNNRFSVWETKYSVTMVIDMVATPLIGLPLLSMIVQELPEAIPAESYVFILVPATLIFLSYFVLIALNSGLKGAAVQFANFRQDAKEAIEIVKKE